MLGYTGFVRSHADWQLGDVCYEVNMNSLLKVAVLLLFGLGSVVWAAEERLVRLETCLKAASKIKAGEYVKVESIILGGVPSYEIEVRDAEGVEWELMCDRTTGRIYEIEREVDSAADPLFAKRAKVKEADARAAVLELYPGEIKEIEYEIESNGDPTFEFDVVDAQGRELKVEVNAITGEIIEVAFEEWEIGIEPEERKASGR